MSRKCSKREEEEEETIMAKLVIDRYEQRVLYPELPVKHYRVHCSLITSNNQRHDTYCDLAKEPNSPVFDFTCFDNADIDEFDYKNKWKMSEQVIRWAHDNILETKSHNS